MLPSSSDCTLICRHDILRRFFRTEQRATCSDLIFSIRPISEKSPASIGLTMTAGLLVWACLTGCGGFDTGNEIRVPVERRYVIGPQTATTDEIRLPGDQLLNIHLKSGMRDPGPVGTAREEVDATPNGEAFARVEATDGGTASASFRLGHSIDNTAGEPRLVRIRAEYDFEYRVDATSPPAPGTLATAELNLLVVDRRHRVAARLPIAQLSSDSVRTASTSRASHSLEAVLESGRTCHIMLHGHAEARAELNQQAGAALTVRGFRLFLRFSPAPPATSPATAATHAD